MRIERYVIRIGGIDMSLLFENGLMHDMEQKLEKELLRCNKGNHILSDIRIDREDYEILKKKITEADISNNYCEYLERYRICTLVTWVYGIREFGNALKVFEQVNKLFDSMPQHLKRHIIEIYNDTFLEYGLNYAMENVYSVEDLLTMLVLQSGFTKQEIEMMCKQFRDKADYALRGVFEADMPLDTKRAHIIREYVKAGSIGKVMVAMRKLYIDILKSELDFDDIIRKNKLIPERIICDMYDLLNEKGEFYINESGKCC